MHIKSRQRFTFGLALVSSVTFALSVALIIAPPADAQGPPIATLVGKVTALPQKFPAKRFPVKIAAAKKSARPVAVISARSGSRLPASVTKKVAFIKMPVKPAGKITPAKKSVPLSNALSASWQAAAVEIVAAGRGRINYEVGVIKAIGLGAIAPPTLKKSRSQDILDARDAAVNDAIRSLSIAVSQVRVTADTRVSNYVMKNDDIRLRVEAMLRNAEVVEEKILPKSGVYRVVVQARMSGGRNSLLAAIGDAPALPAMRPSPAPLATPAPLPSPESDNAPGAPAPPNVEYTSLIVDCRGLRMSACMSPRLYDTHGNEVYGTMKIAPEYVIETGIASFPRSMTEALRCNRTGCKPLIVRATGVADDNRFYAVIRPHDAERARAANQSSRFFERTAVVFLLDRE